MRHSPIRMAGNGVIAGLFGGLLIAAWFLIFDAVHGHPFESPELLAAALLHSGRAPIPMDHVAWVMVAQYSAVHFAAFAILGAIGGLLLGVAEEKPEMFALLLLFTVGFEVFFIELLMFLGPAAVVSMPWWKVLSGNLMATAAMVAVFMWLQPELAKNLLGPWITVVREGVVAGLIGGVIVAGWFLIADFASGKPFHTPAILGTLLFNGLRQTGTIEPTLALVLGYSVLHFFAFVMFGVAASITMAASEREPLVALGVLVLFLWFELCFAGFVTLLDQRALEEIGWWNIIGGNVLALAAIFTFYEIGHPRVLPRMMERWDEMRDEPAAARRQALRGG
ncbi:MAG TPA: hypothetical protein VMT61_09985 [Candidatus Binataceae bacterium]|nr:hypothetical protein [Candidatus Binataceae bacterium]